MEERWMKWMDEVSRRRTSKTHERGRKKRREVDERMDGGQVEGVNGGKIEGMSAWLTMEF